MHSGSNLSGTCAVSTICRVVRTHMLTHRCACECLWDRPCNMLRVTFLKGVSGYKVSAYVGFANLASCVPFELVCFLELCLFFFGAREK